jgi:hypothetical protein
MMPQKLKISDSEDREIEVDVGIKEHRVGQLTKVLDINAKMDEEILITDTLTKDGALKRIREMIDGIQRAIKKNNN